MAKSARASAKVAALFHAVRPLASLLVPLSPVLFRVGPVRFRPRSIPLGSVRSRSVPFSSVRFRSASICFAPFDSVRFRSVSFGFVRLRSVSSRTGPFNSSFVLSSVRFCLLMLLYFVLRSGKSSLLNVLAGRVPAARRNRLQGTVDVGGVSLHDFDTQVSYPDATIVVAGK